MVTKHRVGRPTRLASRPAKQAPTGSESVVAVAVITATVWLVAIGCPVMAAPAVAGSAGLAGVNAARRLNGPGGRQ